MNIDFEKIFSIVPAQIPMPEKARIFQSIRCEECGERTMSARILNDPVLTGGKNLCIPYGHRDRS